MTDIKELYSMAVSAAKMAYAPYSGFHVGAAILCRDGTVFTGCNIENASYSLTGCAERVALFSAVAAGHRDFVAIAVCGGRDGDYSSPCSPCGACRQALAEFCKRDMQVVLADGNGSITAYTLGELLPLSFDLADTEES